MFVRPERTRERERHRLLPPGWLPIRSPYRPAADAFVIRSQNCREVRKRSSQPARPPLRPGMSQVRRCVAPSHLPHLSTYHHTYRRTTAPPRSADHRTSPHRHAAPHRPAPPATSPLCRHRCPASHRMIPTPHHIITPRRTYNNIIPPLQLVISIGNQIFWVPKTFADRFGNRSVRPHNFGPSSVSLSAKC